MAPSVVPTYLEYLIHDEREEWPKYHNKLALYYVGELLSSLADYRASIEGICVCIYM